MTKKRTTNKINERLLLFKSSIMFSFLIIALLKPIISFATLIDDTKYEAIHNLDKNNT